MCKGTENIPFLQINVLKIASMDYYIFVFGLRFCSVRASIITVRDTVGTSQIIAGGDACAPGQSAGETPAFPVESGLLAFLAYIVVPNNAPAADGIGIGDGCHPHVLLSFLSHTRLHAMVVPSCLQCRPRIPWFAGQ